MNPTSVVAVSFRLPSEEPGQDDRGHDHRGRQAGRDEDLREGDPPARDRLDDQVDGGAVVDLGADGRGPDDERDERHHRPDDERVEDRGRRRTGRR